MPFLTTFLFALAASASAKPVVTLRDSPLSSLHSRNSDINANPIRDIMQRDRAKIQDLATASSNGKSTSFNSVGTHLPRRSSKYDGGEYVTYTVSIGNPSQDYDLLIDLEAAFTWVGSKKTYSMTNSSKSLGEQFALTLGVGNITGDLYNDTLSFGDGLSIQIPIGVASQTGNFSDIYDADGVLGLGPAIQNSFYFNSSSIMPPTVIDTLYEQGRIKKPKFGFVWSPFDTDLNEADISWGKCDKTKYNAPLTTVNITNTSPSSFYWGIDLKVKYGNIGNDTLLTPQPISGFFDTSLTFSVYLEPTTFQKYMNAVGAVFDEYYQLPKIHKNQTSSLQSMFLNIGDTDFNVTAAAQLVPDEYNIQMNNGTDEYSYLSVTMLPASQNNPQFILGYWLLERFYTCFDSLNKQVSIATTIDTLSTGN